VHAVINIPSECNYRGGVRILSILRELQLILIYIEVGCGTSLEIVNRGIIAVLM
jgi:hypothetical protein